MAGPYDLTGQNIENTYQRIIQTPDGTNFYDGTGSAVTIGAGGVTKIIAGSGISVSPTTGLGDVTVTNLGAVYNTMTGSYGSFYDTGSYLATSITNVYSMSLSTTDISNGVYVSGSDKTRIYFTNAGVYNIQFSAQFSNTDNAGVDTTIWVRKNDVGSINDIPDSAGVVTVPPVKAGQNGQTIAGWNYYISVAANDYVQLLWTVDVANKITLATIPAGVSPAHPRVPALILTAQRIDTFLSNTGSFSGSFTGEHTGSFTGSFTGSLLGTSSWAQNSITSYTPISTTGSTIYSTSPLTSNPSPNNGIFLGNDAGAATNNSYAVFLGYNAGKGATNTNESIYIGASSGVNAVKADHSVFLGSGAGNNAASASYSILVGAYAGWAGNTISESIGTNNILIGNYISLPSKSRDSINIGGIIFATGSYSNMGTVYSGSQYNIGRVGINKVTPTYTLDVSGSGNYSNGLTVTGSLIAPTITGSLQGTASWAQSASVAISSSYSLSSSYALSASNAISSSYALSASYALSSSRAITSSYALTASNTPNALVTASVSSNTITFTKGDGSTFPITVDTGSGGGTIGPGITDTLVLWDSTSTVTSSSITYLTGTSATDNAVVEDKLYNVNADGLKILNSTTPQISSSVNSNINVNNISPAGNYIMIPAGNPAIIKHLNLYQYNVANKSGCYGMILDFNIMLVDRDLQGDQNEFVFDAGSWPNLNAPYYVETGRIYLSWLGADPNTGGAIGKGSVVTYLTMNRTISNAQSSGWDEAPTIPGGAFPSQMSLAASEEGVVAPYGAPVFRDQDQGYQFGYKLVNNPNTSEWYVEVALWNDRPSRMYVTHTTKLLTLFSNP